MLGTTANKITFFRVLLIPVFLALIYSGRMTAAFAVFLLASLSDFADGYVARRFHQTSTFGKFMDPLADKMLVLSAMCFFIENRQMSGWCVALVLFREFAVSFLRLLAVEQGRVIAASRSGKVKTAVTMLCISVMLLFSEVQKVNIISSFLIAAVTLYSGAEYFIVNKSVFQDVK